MTEDELYDDAFDKGYDLGKRDAEQQLESEIKRLRDCAQGVDLGADGMGWSPNPELMREAASEIERLHNRVMHLELYLKGGAYCPCCTGLRECEEGCTFAQDDPEAHERMLEVRAVLYGG
jgi:hypothetical protein